MNKLEQIEKDLKYFKLFVGLVSEDDTPPEFLGAIEALELLKQVESGEKWVGEWVKMNDCVTFEATNNYMIGIKSIDGLAVMTDKLVGKDIDYFMRINGQHLLPTPKDAEAERLNKLKDK